MSWRIAEWLSRLLDPAEREAVLGDIAESHERGGHALRDVLSLVVRRQGALWLDWRPWLVLAALIVPLGTLLSTWAIFTADGTAVPIWMYADNWTSTYLTNPRARLDLLEIGAGILLEYFTLVCCSWSSGFVLGFLSRRSIPIQGALFCLVLAQRQFLWQPAGPDPLHAAVFAMQFYRSIFPFLVLLLLTVLPAVWGMRHGLRLASLRPSIRRCLQIVSIATLVLIALRSWVGLLPGFLVPLYVQLAGLHGERLRLISLIAYWPVAYFFAKALAHRPATLPSNVRNAPC